MSEFPKYAFMQVHSRLLGVMLEQLDDSIDQLKEWEEDRDDDEALGIPSFRPNEERIDIALQIRLKLWEVKTDIDTLLVEKD